MGRLTTPTFSVDLPPGTAHGTTTSYAYHGCRCLVCKEYKRVYNREYQLRNIERFRAQRRAEYKNNPERFKRANKAHVQRRARILARYKEMVGCLICGYRQCHLALEFHHRDPAVKKFNVAMGKGHSWERIKAEVAKCDVLCSNCHRIVEWGKRWVI